MKRLTNPINNPHNIAAFLMVDVSPRWLNGHTILDKCSSEDALELARFVQKASLVCEYLAERSMPLIVVEQTQIERLDVTDLRGKSVAICGLYGGLCIKEAKGWLSEKNIKAIQVVDLIVWPPSEKRVGMLATELFPDLRKLID